MRRGLRRERTRWLRDGQTSLTPSWVGSSRRADRLSRELAFEVQRSVVDDLREVYPDADVVDLGTKTALFYVLVSTRMPAILFEAASCPTRTTSAACNATLPADHGQRDCGCGRDLARAPIWAVGDEIAVRIPKLVPRRAGSRKTRWTDTLETRLRQYLKHRGINNPGDVTQQVLSDWLVDMHDDGLAANSIARHRVAMRQLFKFLVDEALLPDNPSLLISAPRIPRKLPATLTEAQVSAILGLPIAARRLGCGTPRCSSCCTPQDCASASWSSCAVTNGTMAGSLSRVRVEKQIGSMQGQAKVTVEQYLAIRTDSSDAMFVTVRGGPMTRQNFWTRLKLYVESLG